MVIEHLGAKVYTYTRVSTIMQVDGFSLDAQKERINSYIEYQKMQIVGEYSDEGKSGKNIIERDGFQRMMEDITERKNDVSFVIVFKLSRFGRNVADILTTLKTMKLYGVHLICVEDNIDSSLDSGKLMISILGAMAEIERDNILVQTMAGRKEKARKGLWNGGQSPYGYDVVDDMLVINKEEAEIVKLIYDKYVKTTLGFPSIAKWLNDGGYTKKVKSHIELSYFTPPFIQKIIDNPVYKGAISYGRRKTVQRKDNPDLMHIVKSDEYIITENAHEPIISKEIWDSAQIKRRETGGRKTRKEKDHEYILSGLVKCPICGRPLYGISCHSKKRKDGSFYPPSYSYKCRKDFRDKENGHNCKFGQIACNKIDGQVRDIIMSLVDNESFSSELLRLSQEKVDDKYVKSMLEKANKDYYKSLRIQADIERDLDNLDFDDKHYFKKKESLNRRLENAFELIADAEKRKADAEDKLKAINEEMLTKESIYEFLRNFHILYDVMSNMEKKTFMQLFIKRIDLYPNKTRKGVSIKAIEFNFPVSYKGESVLNIEFSRPKENHVESIISLRRENVNGHIDIKLDIENLENIKHHNENEEKVKPNTISKHKTYGIATYADIKGYVLKTVGLKVTSLQIAQTKEKYKIKERKNYNKGNNKSQVPKCPETKEKAIVESFRYFGLIE